MSVRRTASRGEAAEEDGGDEGSRAPSAAGGEGGLEAPNPAVLMPDILEKLKLLGYEEFADEHVERWRLHAAYFVVPHPKPNEQFFFFTSLFAWLMKLNRFNFAKPDRFEDPNITTRNILEGVKRAKIAFDYPAAKLKQGHGEAVCVLLNLLCNAAIDAQGIRLAPPTYPSDSYPEEAPVDEEEEVGTDIADTVAVNEEEEDETYSGAIGSVESKREEVSRENKILESATDPNAWKIEVENVAPLLKMRVEIDNKEWRTHLEQTKELQGNIENKVPSTQDHLGKLSNTIQQAIESISTREKYLNSQYKNLMQEYHEVQEQLEEVTKKFDERNRDVSERSNQLTQITENLEQIKSQMDERGESMTDTVPLLLLLLLLLLNFFPGPLGEAEGSHEEGEEGD
uniref:Intraflagellar transport protein 57 homolog n=1 Tax=Guillardia theta TaxID=55529 RepID=A0A6U5VW81_GUITH|mmetsp:Transcript_11561/g.39913  ORF Transcript_11561/g.39913 Transcript_11561/m.39913 type:complete len:399 (+) Transcript_11561:33-1229(+)